MPPTLSQAEHDEAARPSSSPTMPASPMPSRRGRAPSATCLARHRGESWRRHGAIILVRGWDEAVPLIDASAPEHLELAVRRRRGAGGAGTQRRCDLPRPPYAGAIGDYVAGTNHVCRRAAPASPRAGRARLREADLARALRCREPRRDRPGAQRLAEAEASPARPVAVDPPRRLRRVRGRRDDDEQRIAKLSSTSVSSSLATPMSNTTAVAIFDLLEENSFVPVAGNPGRPLARHRTSSICGPRGRRLSACVAAVRQIRNYLPICES